MPSVDFEAAARWLSTSPNASNQSNTTKLEIYGLYKYLTVSPRPKPGSRPGMFDWTGSAKWDSWDETGKKYASPESVEARYIEIAKSLGWSGPDPEPPTTSILQPQLSLSAALASGPSRTDEIDLENLSDDDNDVPATRSGGGMGIKVSLLEKPDGAGTLDDTIHGYAISGDAEKVRRSIRNGAILDGRDAYGFTPLQLASDRGHLEVVKCLLDAGANLDLRTTPEEQGEEGESALDMARLAGHDDIVQLLLSQPSGTTHISTSIQS